jgi:hypothetical protein
MAGLSFPVLSATIFIAAITVIAQTLPAAADVDLTTTLVDVNTNQGLGPPSTSARPGGSVAVRYKINNLGSQAGSAGNIGFYLSKTLSLAPSSIFLVYANLFDAVPASGSTKDQVGNITLPSSLQGGNYFIIVVVNYDHEVSEVDYTNNPSNPLPITVSAAPH